MLGTGRLTRKVFLTWHLSKIYIVCVLCTAYVRSAPNKAYTEYCKRVDYSVRTDMKAFYHKCKEQNEIGMISRQADEFKYAFLPFDKLTSWEFFNLFKNVRRLVNIKIHLYNSPVELIAFSHLKHWNFTHDHQLETQMLVVMNCSKLRRIKIGSYKNRNMGKRKVMIGFNNNLDDYSRSSAAKLMSEPKKERKATTKLKEQKTTTITTTTSTTTISTTTSSSTTTTEPTTTTSTDNPTTTIEQAMSSSVEPTTLPSTTEETTEIASSSKEALETSTAQPTTLSSTPSTMEEEGTSTSKPATTTVAEQEVATTVETTIATSTAIEQEESEHGTTEKSIEETSESTETTEKATETMNEDTTTPAKTTRKSTRMTIVSTASQMEISSEGEENHPIFDDDEERPNDWKYEGEDESTGLRTLPFHILILPLFLVVLF